MNDEPTPQASDPDTEAVARALLRAARRAREVARQTGTGIVIRRDGVLVEEPVSATDDEAES